MCWFHFPIAIDGFCRSWPARSFQDLWITFGLVALVRVVFRALEVCAVKRIARAFATHSVAATAAAAAASAATSTAVSFKSSRARAVHADLEQQPLETRVKDCASAAELASPAPHMMGLSQSMILGQAAFGRRRSSTLVPVHGGPPGERCAARPSEGAACNSSNVPPSAVTKACGVLRATAPSDPVAVAVKGNVKIDSNTDGDGGGAASGENEGNGAPPVDCKRLQQAVGDRESGSLAEERRGTLIGLFWIVTLSTASMLTHAMTTLHTNYHP